ncbi:hypothetical protein, partial [Nocardia cyriacigeorgica]|uniref:hypothetical protein n=1 Tax=Nocardia cyriacigeorgica TaxID=135487 RepID=UPI002455DCB6
GHFDAAIGNVPFSSARLHDPVHNAGEHTMHNHFILKSHALTKPGGLVAVGGGAPESRDAHAGVTTGYRHPASASRRVVARSDRWGEARGCSDADSGVQRGA